MIFSRGNKILEVNGFYSAYWGGFPSISDKGKKGKPYLHSCLLKISRRALKKAEIKNSLTLYQATRPSAASNLVKRGIPYLCFGFLPPRS